MKKKLKNNFKKIFKFFDLFFFKNFKFFFKNFVFLCLKFNETKIKFENKDIQNLYLDLKKKIFKKQLIININIKKILILQCNYFNFFFKKFLLFKKNFFKIKNLCGLNLKKFEFRKFKFKKLSYNKTNIFSLQKFNFIKKPIFQKKAFSNFNFLRKNKFYFKSNNVRVRQVCYNTVFLCLSLLTLVLLHSSNKFYFFEKSFFDVHYIYIIFYLILPFIFNKLIKNLK